MPHVRALLFHTQAGSYRLDEQMLLMLVLLFQIQSSGAKYERYFSLLFLKQVQDWLDFGNRHSACEMAQAAFTRPI
jgi:hypothetical protein